ncbi:DUF2339 domain-containing protein [Wenzhouxiangella sp. XN79A]|uniref:DUF2339 domain-containing protein n=1 Tax=Wenzhouxiangella sp. XN79A TaxID=2724193 RepID=UPI00144AA152|nr:DUF2339 domain-containing protein [Wenzhouxiangella sp. XN79A]NKI36464.1 DUF2339 domain-containing protein [Wenzhouxiangella sp. XN79A]
MESVVALFLLGCLLLVLGGILGLVAFARTNALKREVQDLKDRVAFLAQQRPKERDGDAEPVEPPELRRATPTAAPPPSRPAEPAPARPATMASDSTAADTEQPTTRSPKVEPTRETDPAASSTRPSAPAPPAPPTSSLVFDPWPFLRALQRNWMAWLGGLSIALAGIFLARYAIEQGLLGPGARIALGLGTGVALHAGAAWLLKKSGSHPALAAMAGGGSITLFATLLAALHSYQMFSPTLVFVVLALVALATMWLAVSHGPLLAIIGMLGAYAVPILVSTGSGKLFAALVYALIITGSVLLLARVVRIGWLWWGAVLGALGWWYLSLTGTQVDGFRGLYLAVLAYLLMAVCSGNWRLAQAHPGEVWLLGPARGRSNDPSRDGTDEDHPPSAVWEQGLPIALLGIVGAQLVSVLHSGWVGHWPTFLALPALLLFVSLGQPRLLALVWMLLLGSLACIGVLYASFPNADIGRLVDMRGLNEPLTDPSGLLFSLACLGLLYLLAAFWGDRYGRQRAWWASLLAMTPTLCLLTAYLTASPITSTLYWTLLFAGVAAVQMAIAVIASNRVNKQTTDQHHGQWIGIWHFIAGHFGYAIAVAVAFEAATLTLALAAQVLSLAWLIQRFDVRALGWLLKLVVLLVVVRLTANPWLVDYPATWHWPLWTYGGSTLLCWLASRQLAGYPKLREWTEVASLHLFVLTVWAEARYLLHDGRAFFADYSFSEATLYIGLAGALNLVYHYRARISGELARWYHGYSILLLAFGLLNYLGILINLANSEPWAVTAIGEQPVFNLLTLALGLPIVFGALYARYYGHAGSRARKLAALFVGIASFLFVSFQVRHLWQGTVSLQTGTSSGELYTYSIVWLVMAVAAMLLAGVRQWQNLYRGGLAMLAVVILKIFLIDLSDLDGLLRVASFMGLGLALVGISFLHQRIKPGTRATDT